MIISETEFRILLTVNKSDGYIHLTSIKLEESTDNVKRKTIGLSPENQMRLIEVFTKNLEEFQPK